MSCVYVDCFVYNISGYENTSCYDHDQDGNDINTCGKQSLKKIFYTLLDMLLNFMSKY